MTDRITIRQTVSAHLGEPPELLIAIRGWLEANGLDPVRVSGRHDIVVDNGAIHYHEVCTDADGNQLIDLTSPGRSMVATSYRTAPLVVPMPDEWPALPDVRAT